MATLSDANALAVPIGNMAPIGRDELGNPVYRNALTGATYMLTQPQQATDGGWSFGGMMNALAAPFRLAGGRGTEADVVGVQNALAGVLQGATAPGRAAMGEPVTLGDVWSTALDYGVMGAPMAAPEGAIRANSFRAFHGSPHTFDRFDLGKIGTGEGAQAYGHGLYFAQSEDVARSYRSHNSANAQFEYNGRPITDESQQSVAWYLSQANGDKQAVREQWAQMYRPSYFETPQGRRDMRLLDQMNYDKLRSGSMYEVQINADPNAFLNWDAPLSAQPENVRQWFDSRGIGPGFAGEQPGSSLYLAENSALGGPDNVSAAMREGGVPGIAYLDHGSRFNAMDGLGPQTQTRNFVVFDDKIIDILRRYGIGAAAIGGGWAMTPDDAQKVNDMGILNGA